MALANYTDLKAAVASWVNRTDLTTTIVDCITLYEADANRRIRIRQNMYTTPLTLTAGAASVNTPSRFLEEVELNYADTDAPLHRGTLDLIDRVNTTSSTPGRPFLYLVTGSTIIFDTEADVNYTINLRYYKTWDIATDTTNWLLTNAPDAYLFGAVAEVAMFLMDTNMLQIAIPRRDAATDWVLKSDSRIKSSPLRVDPALQCIGGW